jgi:CDP-diacylglycerol--glycerol-3-phosphate 3-phosphatidyltransferase
MRRVDVDTYFWPVIQAGVLGIKEEEKGLGRVWEAVGQSFSPATVAQVEKTVLEEDGKQETKEEEKEKVVKGVQVDLTSGYFGLYDKYKRMVIESPAPVRVIAASPKVSLFTLEEKTNEIVKRLLWLKRSLTPDSRRIYLPRKPISPGCNESREVMG